jgi:membrane associated rhomboid family serine protease
MGLQDRDYLRDEQPPGMQLRAPQSMVTILMIANAAFYLVDFVFFSGQGQHALMLSMACTVNSLIDPWMWWQLLTSGFAHSPVDPWHIAINMFMLWSFGRAVEPVLGRWEFLRFYLLAVVFGSITFCLEQLVLVGVDSRASALGASGAVTAVTILFALQNPKATVYFMLFIPMKAWVAALIMVVVNLLGTQGVHTPGGANIAYGVHLAGAAFALAYFFFRWNLGVLWPFGSGGSSGGWKKIFRRQPNLRVHSPDAPVADDGRYADQDAEADRILIKIDHEGIDSLTPRERKIMDDYSRRMKQKHR